MRECEHLEKISRLIDKDLSPVEERQARSHLAHCAKCQRAEKSFLALRRRIRSMAFVHDEAAAKKSLEEILRGGRAKREKQAGTFSIWQQKFATGAFAIMFLAATAVFFLYHRAYEKSFEVASRGGSPRVGAKEFSGQTRLKIGEWLETDAASEAEIKVADIGSVRVEPESKIRLVETGPDEHRLELSRGSIAASIKAPPRLFFVETPSATVIDYGCRYTLNVDETGAAVLHVTEGWVSLWLNGRESIVPASAYAKSKPGTGPGTPFFEDATGAFIDALTRFDFENGGAEAVETIIKEARPRDALSLWYLLERAGEKDRARVFERLASFVPPPDNASREGILPLDRKMLDSWKEMIDVVSAGESLSLKKPDSNAGSIISGGTMNTPRAGHAATRLPDGRILMTGGIAREGEPLASAEIYEPGSGKFVPAGTMNAARYGHTATLLGNDRILIAGGTGADGKSLSEAEIYDPVIKIFEPVGAMTAARSNHRATLLDNGKVLITGGAGLNEPALAEAEFFDPGKNVFQKSGRMLVPRAFHTATLLKNGDVLIAGGNSGGLQPETTLSGAEIFDFSNGSFVPTGDMKRKRYSHAAVLLNDGRVLITGGSSGAEWKGRLRDAEIFDPNEKTFVSMEPMSLPRFNHQAATLALENGRVVIAGSGARVEIFDPSQNSFFSANGNTGTGRIFSTVTLLPGGGVLITGGYNLGYSPTPDAWLFNPKK